MYAWAAEKAVEGAAGAAEHGAEAFYATAEFWVAVAFVIFVGLTYRTVYRVVTVALDDTTDTDPTTP